MGWFTLSKKEINESKINEIISGFNISHKYISNDGSIALLLDDVNQIFGVAKAETGKLETMNYSDIFGISYDIDSREVIGMFDINYINNKKELEEYIKIVRPKLVEAIENTELFTNIVLRVETNFREKDFWLEFYNCGLRKPPKPMSDPIVKLSVDKYLEFVDFLNDAILSTKGK